MKTAIIDVGGGLRGIYGAGVFDRLIDEKAKFDRCVGVSAGSANIASFLAGQKGRNRLFYMDYAFRKQYMSVANMLKNGAYLNLDYIYGILSNSDGENPLDYKAMCENPTEFTAVATDAVSGKPVYFGKDFMTQDDYSVLKASCAIPVVCHPYKIKDRYYFDGGISDPVPIKKIAADGFERIVLILTKPQKTVLNNRKEVAAARLVRYKYPNVEKALKMRAENYYHSLKIAQWLTKEGKALIVAPDDIEGMDTLTKDKSKLNDLYEKGYNDAGKIKSFIEK